MARLDLCRSRYLTRNKFSKAKFEQACLEEYCQTFPTVCGDLTFYQFPSEQYWAKLFDATADSCCFRSPCAVRSILVLEYRIGIREDGRSAICVHILELFGSKVT